VSLNDTVESIRRSYADVSLVTQNTTTLKVRSRIGDDLFNALSFSHQERTANSYVNGNTWALLTNGGVNADLTPSFMVYSEASRRHDDVKETIDWSPLRSLNVSLIGKFARDTYPQSQNGLRNNMNASIGPDVSWDVSPNLSAHAYYTYQKIYYETGDVYYSSGTPSTICTTGYAGCNGYTIPYNQQTNDYVHAAGVTIDWKAIPDVLKFAFNYTFSYGDTAYAIGDGMAVIGTGLTSQSTVAQVAQLQALPDIKSMLNMVSIRGEYTFRPNWTVIFGYAYERFTYKDFMNVSSTQYANAIFPGTLNPNDSVHVVGAGLRVRF
jgi:opacity protein-like surface antigen